jgi:hypothetical protein
MLSSTESAQSEVAAERRGAQPSLSKGRRSMSREEIVSTLLAGLERLSGRTWTPEDRLAMARAVCIESEQRAWRRRCRGAARGDP